MFTAVIPKLPFINKEKMLDFYVRQLSFQLTSDYGDYVLLRHGNVELHFFSFPDLVPQKSDFMIYLRIDADIDGLYKRLQELGIKIHPNGKLEVKPWQQKEFSIIDPNGTLLTFGQSVK